MREGRTARRATSARLLACLRKVLLRILCPLTTLMTSSATNAIELVDYGREPANVDYASMIQTFNRFLVDSICIEGNAFPHNPVLLPSRPANALLPAAAPVTQLMGLDAKTLVICRTCNAIRKKESLTHVVDLTYPRRVCFSRSISGTV